MTKAISIRLPVADLDQAQQIAAKEGIGYQTVLKPSKGLKKVSQAAHVWITTVRPAAGFIGTGGEDIEARSPPSFMEIPPGERHGRMDLRWVRNVHPFGGHGG
ncbi:MAG: hypothetical protein EXQ52_00460 [Bryobacterales bacterium]|nr:hypothetical protein [Bryobacterales bacterium]